MCQCRAVLSTALHNASAREEALEDYPAARALLEEAVTIERSIGDVGSIAQTLMGLGDLLLLQGEHERAESYIQEALPTLHRLGFTTELGYALPDLAVVAFKRGDTTRAARLLAAGEAVHRQSGFVLDPESEETRTRQTEQLRAMRTDPEIDAAWREGEEMTLDAAVSYAIDEALRTVRTDSTS